MSTDQHKEKDNELKKLNNDLLELRKIIDQSHSIEEDKIAYNDLKKTIDNKLKDKEEGKRIRARVDKTLQDEKPSKYFFNKEKKRGESKQINILKTKDSQQSWLSGRAQNSQAVDQSSRLKRH